MFLTKKIKPFFFYTKIPGIPYRRSKADIVVSKRFKVSTKNVQKRIFSALNVANFDQTTMQNICFWAYYTNFLSFFATSVPGRH
jgi:hypothetical protein